jgi:hypothetical protein
MLIFMIRNPGGFLIRLRLFAACCLAFLFSVGAFAQANTDDAKPLPTIADKTKQFKKLDGFFPVYWDERKGKVWLEISRWSSEFLFLDSLPAGIGSNDIGLDRGQLGEGRVVEFERVGPRVLLKQLNLNYRASSDNPAERRSVQDAFAQSVLWGFEVAAEENDRVLVDATAFFMSDAHHVAETLKKTKQGTFKIEASRSAIYLDDTRNFPQNTEVEATLTFTVTSDEPGKWVQDVTPDPSAITVREHYSFIQLPDNNYQPRADCRAGYDLPRRPRDPRSHPKVDPAASCWLPSHPGVVLYSHWHDLRSYRRGAVRCGSHAHDFARPGTRRSTLAGHCQWT